MRPLVIYIHGFLSSPQSIKAQETQQYIDSEQLAVELLTPGLSNYPMQAYQQLQAIVEQHSNRQMALIGSSLGGFMATALAEAYDLKALVINPAVRPYELISGVLGENKNPYTGETFFLDASHIEELHQLEVQTLSKPERIKVLLQTGDETLDYRKAVSYYQGCPQLIEEGGDHRFQGFENHLPEAFKFLELQ
ncbi:YqiA/YcfP family alpha/beta fold hydrolase [Oceanicoccus sagamiensis]|uniref:Esterase YqiA n=1 Tax=Oceanicoccus sagamiensis TaxID=716816 RepID=A0A1X9ND63_9GAMM|nr:YqiA/YcfP family alpha/beta fold hydrolase [Oceanicoccus sagamiensis]ARN73845.1 esterase YqiA [Oceanicoccus sagamiensis]